MTEAMLATRSGATGGIGNIWDFRLGSRSDPRGLLYSEGVDWLNNLAMYIGTLVMMAGVVIGIDNAVRYVKDVLRGVDRRR